MFNIPSARLTVPRAVTGEIIRKNLLDIILNSPAKLVYIHAGAGYGKTTLLSQAANRVENAVWLSLDGENDIFTFINTLCEAVKQTFPQFDFSASEYLPFSGKENFISMLAGALICSIENLSGDFIVVIDDLHTIKEDEVLDHVLNKKNTRLMPESLVSRNTFTIKTGAGFYRYHALFRSSLLETGDKGLMHLLMQKAARYYFDREQYSRAARYAIDSKNYGFLGKIILACYRDYIKAGNFNELRIWFLELNDAGVELSPGLLVAKGAFLSVLGNFVEAKVCLEAAIPLLSEEDKELYFEAMVHKARVLRNFISFEESNRLLDELIAKLDNPADELAYSVVIEKLYNLCWNSQIGEAYALARRMIESCANAGNVKVMRWFERYLCTIHFFSGRMKESVYYYEKSLELPEDERNFLGVHSTGIYVAKAYQMMGERSRSLSILAEELQRLRNTGNYEEMWAGYLLAAEIHYQNTFIDRLNGKTASYETAVKYFALADEYAPLYRKTNFQMHWAKMQRLTCSLIFTNDPKEDIVREIFENLDKSGAYLKSVVLARLMGYFTAISDYPNAVKCAKLCIETGENSGMLLHMSHAYGVLARAAIAAQDHENAKKLTAHHFKLCHDNGLYEYFRVRKAYDPVLEFAYNNGIEPEITRHLMEFAGYVPKKAYVETLGAFTVYRGSDRREIIKFRTKKERELLAFLLDAGDRGATKEQIYNAIWFDSDSNNIKNLIAVNLRHLKHDLECAGIEKSVICKENRYFICRDEIDCDSDHFVRTYEEFRKHPAKEQAKKLLSLYKGEYLSDFEAQWAVAKKIRYQEIYEEAAEYCLSS